MIKKWAEMPYCSYRFSGADSIAFLQGQLTQDINAITQSTCQYGAYCNHQGGMLANILISSDSDDIILRVHENIADRTMKRLKMFILRAAVNIETVNVKHIGMNKSSADSICRKLDLTLPAVFSASTCEQFKIFALPLGYFELRTADKEILFFIDSAFEKSFDDIEQLRIFSGNFHITPQTIESILPQETPLEEWGSINYTKGCYVGQEIIARSKYRGKVRKGLAVAKIDKDINIDFNKEIFANEKSVGKIIEYHQGKNSMVCLALLMLSTDPSSCLVSDKEISFEFI